MAAREGNVSLAILYLRCYSAAYSGLLAATTYYIFFLSPPLSTPEQVQEIGNLSQLPEVRPVNEDLDAEEQHGDEQPAGPTSCCVVDRSTKDAIVRWSRSLAKTILPIIPVIPTESADTTQALRASYPVPYFIYGAFKSPILLQNILGLEQPPFLQFAAVMGYESRRWDKDIALVASAETAMIEGLVYVVPSEEVVGKLADQYGFAFEAVICQITLDNGESVEGNIFQYRGHRLGLENLTDNID